MHVFRYKSHYTTLGVKETATQKEIKAAFIKLSKKVHVHVLFNPFHTQIGYPIY